MRSRSASVLQRGTWLAAGLVSLGALYVAACGDDVAEAVLKDEGDAGLEASLPIPTCEPACATPGAVCIDAKCVTDCRQAGAAPCADGTVCSVGQSNEGQCVVPTAACATSSKPEACDGVTCGPGTACNGKGACYPRVPCGSMRCEGKVCWGELCGCDRAIDCATAPLGTPGQSGTLHDNAFRNQLADLKFDPQCGAWGVTLRSGTDFVRNLSPQGTVLSVPGVTNLNMGEVGVLRPVVLSPGPRTPAVGVDVAASYICCASCGCQLGSTPQGIAHYEGDGGLPLVIPSTTFTTSPGTLPFGSGAIDTGPEGLTYGADRVLYAGNLNANGDFYSFDLTTRKTTLVTTFAARVHAATPFDANTLLVALEGGEIRKLRLSDATSAPWTVSSSAVTSVVRDFFEGSIYVARADNTLWKYNDNGVGSEWNKTTRPARLSIAPDGKLYALEIVLLGLPTIVSFPLPTKR